jgi:hypothetical protein
MSIVIEIIVKKDNEIDPIYRSVIISLFWLLYHRLLLAILL